MIVDDAGSPVLAKRSTDPEGRARLAREHATLVDLDALDVVEPVDLVTTDEATVLHLRWVGAHSLATVAGLDPEYAGRVVAAVAATVRDLHCAGRAHGRLTADHVLLDGTGMPVLTGLADAQPIDPHLASVDVAALGELLTDTLHRAHQDIDPVDSRVHRSRNAGLRAALLTLADHAQAPDPEVRPTIDAFAAALGDTLPRERRVRPRPAGRRFATRVGVGLVVGMALGGTVAAVGSTRATPGPAPAVAAPTTDPGPTSPSTDAPGLVGADATTPRPSGAPSPATSSPATSSPTTVAPAVDPPAAPPTGPGPDPCGPGGSDEGVCGQPVRVHGERVTFGGRTWVVGRAGDRVVVGDWDCDGMATAASLRPSSGEVFVFDRWVVPGDEVTVDARVTVPGGVALEATDPDGDACPALTVVRDDGGRVPVGLS